LEIENLSRDVCVIISHKHKFIFLHCRKTAGSSISVALAKYLGFRDIQLSAIKETFQAGQRPPLGMLVRGVVYGSSKELLSVVLGKKDYLDAFSGSIKQSFRKKIGSQPQHAYAKEVCAAFPVEWKNYHKFCVVRNPFEKAVSDYYWMVGSLDNPPTFLEFLLAVKAGNPWPGVIPLRPYNWPIYTINDKVVVDSVVRFENLKSDLSDVFRKIGIPWDGDLPNAKGGMRPNNHNVHKSYRSMYTPKERELVEYLFDKEITHFGYKF